MKGSFVRNEREGSVFNRLGRRRFNVTKRKSPTLDPCVHWMESSLTRDMKIRSPAQMDTAAKFPNTVYILSGSLNNPRQTTNLSLPPISGSRSTADPVSVHRVESVNPHTSRGSGLTGTSMFAVFGSQGRTVFLQSESRTKIHVALGGANKAVIWSASQPREPPPSVPADSAIRPKKGISGLGSDHRGGEHDARLSDPKQQRNLFFSDSAVETESDGSSNKDELQTPKEGGDDEYYNDQRIGEWILKVNSSLFSKGNKEITDPTHTQEQDIATIKIMYTGKWSESHGVSLFVN